MDAYVDALIKEIQAFGDDLRERGLHADCLYIGGGTPTALSSQQLNRVLSAAKESFGSDSIREFTVEAGRPDTLDDEKLHIIQKHGVDRICLNPQTMSDRTLHTIGRDHTAKDITQLYEMIKPMSFKSVNMDLIAGLGDETLIDMEDTIKAILLMKPENVTLHTLAVKRASRLNENLKDTDIQCADEVSEMVAYATRTLLEAGYEPYYMYRQKQMIGNHENIGFCLPDKVCLYNVRIMEEQHSILALGAGAISKIYFPEENRLERFSNTKGLEDYLARVDEMISRKKEWLTTRYDLPIIK